ncbi:hypothetical protein AWC38_SpisGene22728 [Stylophora pistillata]|uniref:Uncharacterized protein n=1 Tax=Stylophora pistillata TaxID=50429 RepID=A0A2B4R9Z3_STYPI|nr:hypothetical protein AWC38_SpisGene22728 [Stylophora pistillata]
MAAAKGADGKFWCELLSSDKYRNAEDFKTNKSSHHYSVVSQCSSYPCQNKVTMFVLSVSKQRPNTSQLTTLHIGANPTPVLCHMGDFGCGDGGWTPVMKIDGNKTTFHYSSHYWTDTNDYNLSGGETGFDLQETKLPTYWNTSFSKICLGMKIAEQLSFIVINIQSDSLYSLIADGQYRATSLGRDKWKTLIGSQASLQANCNKEGFNVFGSLSYRSKTRIGILGNNENDCESSDSRIGFGTGGSPDDSKSCGNEAQPNADNGTTFHYSSHYWTDTNDYNLSGAETGFDLQETKLPTYWNTSFSKICLGMKIAEQLSFIVIKIQSDSLYSLIADGQYRDTSLGRDKWKTLIGSQASLQANCNKEGFNVFGSLSYRSKTRIGILGNNENDCDSSDSRIGFGTGGSPDDSKSCGNEAESNADNEVQRIAAMGYILLQ